MIICQPLGGQEAGNKNKWKLLHAQQGWIAAESAAKA